MVNISARPFRLIFKLMIIVSCFAAVIAHSLFDQRNNTWHYDKDRVDPVQLQSLRFRLLLYLSVFYRYYVGESCIRWTSAKDEPLSNWLQGVKMDDHVMSL